MQHRARRGHRGAAAGGAGEPMTDVSGPAGWVFLVDDHELFRSGVRAELGDDFDVVGEASEVDAAVDMILERRPDVVLLDVHLPGGGGREVARRVVAVAPEVCFLALSVSDAAEDVIGVIRAGARGYVTKTISGPELGDAIRRVADGDAVFSRRLAGLRPRRLRRRAGTGRRPRGRPAHRPRAGGPAPDRPRLPVQGGGQGAEHLGPHGGDPRLVGAAQAPALQPPRADPLGQRAPAHLTRATVLRNAPPPRGTARPVVETPREGT